MTTTNLVQMPVKNVNVKNKSNLDDLIWVTLKDDNSFLRIKETLSRIGIANPKEKKLYQSCHILHKQGKYAIVHFKELFKLDGKESTMTDQDIARRNTIAILLEEWDLLKISPETKIDRNKKVPMFQIKVLSYKEKKDWEIVTKYNLGKKRKK